MGTCPFRSSAMPTTAHSATSGMTGQHLLDRTGGEPVAGGVDDVVGAAHDVHVAVVVEVARVGGQVVAVVLRQVRVDPAVIATPEGGAKPGGSGSLTHSEPISPAGAWSPCSSSTGRRSRARPSWGSRGAREVFEPDEVGHDRPASLGLPPMVDSGLSRLRRPGQRVGIASLAGQEERPQPREVVAAHVVCTGSSRLIALIAVGAVNNTSTPWSAQTRQKAPASGVPTGLPS